MANCHWQCRRETRDKAATTLRLQHPSLIRACACTWVEAHAARARAVPQTCVLALHAAPADHERRLLEHRSSIHAARHRGLEPLSLA